MNQKRVLILTLALVVSSCSTKFERTQFIEGTFFPNGTVQLEGRKAESLEQNYVITISQPIYFSELGNIKIHDFWGSERKGGYEKVKDQMSGVLFYEAAKTKKQTNLSEFYIPLVKLNQNGRFVYQKRTLSTIEWIKYHPIFSVAILTILVFITFNRDLRFK
jgi:hypothetical protein